MDHRQGDGLAPAGAQRPPGRCPDHRSVTPVFACAVTLITAFVVLVCGDIHGQYVRGRVLFILSCELTHGPRRCASMIS